MAETSGGMPDAAFELAKRRFFEGLAALQAGRLEDAERAFLASLEAVPGRVSTLLNLGTTRLRMRRPIEAIAAADTVLATQPGDVDALAIRAVALARMGLHTQALAAYDRVVAAEPRLADMWSQRGNLLREMNRLDEAAASYAEARARGGDPALNDWFLAGVGGGEAPAAAPPDYVEGLFDDYAAEFDTHLVDVLGYQGHRLLVENLPVPSERRFASALDLGCGTGLCGAALRPFARRLAGVDLSAAMLEAAGRKNVYDELAQGELTDWMSAHRAAFDLIAATDVFNYIGDLEPVFAAARDALRPGGLLAFSTERDDDAETTLHRGMRYAHSAAYLQRLAAAGAWRIEAQHDVTLRREEGRAVAGQIVVLRSPA
jgi:predicted TPR repeat methyltransferase